jgi:hypothetical protein
MLSKPALSLALTVSLLLSLASPSVALSAHGASARDLGSVWSEAWGWVTALLFHPNIIGCEVDPDGHRCQAATVSVRAASGVHAGCEIDPNGGPRCQASVPTSALPPGPTTDIGCEIDPNGRCLH